VLYISHRLDGIREIGDRVTVLKGMSDLVELQVPKQIVLASETITKNNVDKVPAARIPVLSARPLGVWPMATTQQPELKIGMIGYAFMGFAHSQAWRTVNRVFDLPLRASMVAVAGRDPDKVQAAADRLGWAEAVTGRLGAIRHVRAVYLQDWITDPQFPLVWRLQRDIAGSGALGDIGSHIVDLAQYVTGQRILGVSAVTETFVQRRPLPAQSGGLQAEAADGAGNGGSTGAVTVDDAAIFVARLSARVLATFEATRFATGRKNSLRLEVNGSLGSAVFDLERLNELEFYDAAAPADQRGFARILVTEPDHPYLSAWWPPGHLIGYEHSFTHQARDLLEAIGQGIDPHPSFADAAQVQRVLDAVERSAATGSDWTPVVPTGDLAEVG
jgi:predicted dehydrogenase